MFKRFSVSYMAMLLLLDALLLQSAFALAIHFSWITPAGQDGADSAAFLPPLWGVSAAISIVWLMAFFMLSVYTPRAVVRWFDEFRRVMLGHSTAALFLAGLFYLTNLVLPRSIYFTFVALALLFLLSYRVLLRLWHRLRREQLAEIVRVLIIGAGPSGQALAEQLRGQRWLGVEVVGFLDDLAEQTMATAPALPLLGRIDDAPSVIQHYAINDVVVAAMPRDPHQLINLITHLFDLAVRVHVAPAYFELAFLGAKVDSWDGVPLITLRNPAMDSFQRLLKRLLDIFLAVLALLCSLPLMVLIALAIKLADGGAILYAAERVGEHGRLFTMFKFRSMVTGAEQSLSAIPQDQETNTVPHKRVDDPRVTRVGRFLRRTSLDELPQLFNVLRGEMSLVGPRPELPWLVAQYEPWQRKRLTVPQGMTGWWQVNGRSSNVMHLHTEQDLYYIQNYSLWLDLQILWRTIPAVLRGRGAF